MADSKITALTSIGTITDPAVDPLVIVDVSDTSMAATGTTKKVTLNNLLACSPTATLASATITGDLTVRTNKLAVTSTGVAVGATSAAYPLDVTGIINTNSDAYVQGGRLALYRPAGASYIDIASGQDLVFRGGLTTVGGAGASDFMRLNSTGLGVGASPTRKLSIVGSGATYANINSGDNTSLVGLLLGGTSTPSAGQVIYDNTANSLSLFTSGANRLTIDSSGNVGIGVTPSAWNTIGPVLQIEQASLVSESSNQLYLSANAYFASGNWNYINNSQSSQYYQSAGSHVWRSATASTGAISFSTLMTLDASGNLILQSSATPATLTTNGQLTVNATSNTNLRFSYRGSDGVTRVANITLA